MMEELLFRAMQFTVQNVMIIKEGIRGENITGSKRPMSK